jgi:hypothetical protein
MQKINNLITCKPFFYFNIYTFLLGTFILFMPKNKQGWHDFKMLYGAMRDGMKGRMGKTWEIGG